MRWLNATAAAESFVGIAAEVIDVSDREGDIYQHFARRPDGVEMVVRAHHDRKLIGGGQLFAAAETFDDGFVREVHVAPRGPGDKGRKAKVRVVPARSRSRGPRPPIRPRTRRASRSASSR